MLRPGGTRRAQRGLTTVEFAIVGAVLFMVLFGVMEFSRAMYVVNTLTESTERAARLAAVCPVGDPFPADSAVFPSAGGAVSLIPGLSPANVVIEYLDDNGNVIADPTTNFGEIRYVRARIVNFTLPLIIPIVTPTLTLSGFATTMPRESLGIPRSGTVQPC